MANKVLTEEQAMQRARMALEKMDWARADSLSDEDIARQVASNPDAAPLTPQEPKAGNPVRELRRTLGLTQPEFADRFGIPVGSLRDWEQGRSQPDSSARLLLQVIARAPQIVAAAAADLRR